MDDVTVFKLVSLVSIWLVGLAGGLIPALLASKKKHSPKVQHLLSVLNAFSGGVFLAGGFFHLLHSAIENPALQKWSTMDDGKYEFPYAEMFCTLGFLALLLLEQGAHAKMHSHTTNSNKRSHRDEHHMYMPTKHHDLDADDDHGLEAGESDTYIDDLDDDEESLTNYANDTLKSKHSHGSGGGHGHSHGPSDLSGSGSGSLAVAVVLFIALSFHSVLEGLGIGAQTTSAWGVFMAIIVHKGLAAFALGSGMVQSSLRPSLVILYMILFSFMSIIGIIIGWIVAADSSEDSAGAGICVALASGTFIYVAVMEVIPQEFPRHAHEQQKSSAMLHKTVALCIGYAIFGLLAKWA